MTAVIPPRLESILAEATRIAPNRRKNSDGTIGDAAHQERTSDHNPAADPGTRSPLICHAVDVSQSVPGNPYCTPDVVNFALPGSVLDAHALGDQIAREYIAATPAERAARWFWLKYIVSHNYKTGRAKIFDPSVSLGWRDQPGDPHLSHLHTSIQHAHAAEQFTGPYLTTSSPEDPNMPLNGNDETIIRSIVKQEIGDLMGGIDAHGKAFGPMATLIKHYTQPLTNTLANIVGAIASLKS